MGLVIWMYLHFSVSDECPFDSLIEMAACDQTCNQSNHSKATHLNSISISQPIRSRYHLVFMIALLAAILRGGHFIHLLLLLLFIRIPSFMLYICLQVCRLAYELMQSNHVEMGDASQQFRTLDDIYYFGGQQASPYEVIIPDRKFNLNLGDLVHYHGNHWDGYAKVEKLSSSMKMIAPAFKFYPRLLTANMTGAH
ncbi:unnamed protein product [Trichobilharzia regenti]|nr:unnamed protein product [Trichobilharzia regenti]